jgi:cytochrome c553
LIPSLAGQWAAYIYRQIADFGTGSRGDQNMTDMSSTIASTVDAFDIAAYFASQNQMVGIPHDNEQGKRLYFIYQCVSCHGEAGKGKPLNNPLFPIIGGQNKEYLIKQLNDFKNGLRETDMSGTMRLLSERMSMKEIEAVSDYLSGL